MTAFAPRSDADVLDLIRAFPLATLVTRDFRATPLPLLAETDAEGRLTELVGHFSAANRQLASLAADPRALILFNGPSGYVSPEYVPRRDWAPTWNYAIARIEAEVVLDAAANAAAIEQLTGTVEAGRSQPWSPAEMGERYARLLPRVVAFRARVLGVEATFKLGQDEDAATFSSIVERHPDRVLAEWMERQRSA